MFIQFPVRPYDPSRPVAFMHVPKTSGNALITGFLNALAPRHPMFGLDRSHFGVFQSFETMSAEIRSTIHLDLDAMPSQADFIAGHFAFSTLSAKFDGAQLIAFLREPYSRLLSHWLFLRSLSDDQLSVWGDWGKLGRRASGCTLANFLTCRPLACNVDNIAVRMLLWPHPLIPTDNFIDARDDDVLMSTATARLQHFAYTDIIENPAFQSNLQTWLGRGFSYPKVNETIGIPPERSTLLHQELTTDALALVESHTRLDIQLWMALAEQRVPAYAVQTLLRHTMMRNTARYALLMNDASVIPRPLLQDASADGYDWPIGVAIGGEPVQKGLRASQNLQKTDHPEQFRPLRDFDIHRSKSLAPQIMQSYAQNGEDVVLGRVFADQKLGFYVDIGACHPVEDSVTLHFYERGWHGVNVEPDHDLHAVLQHDRPRDTNLLAAIGKARGRVAFHPTGTRGHGTLDPALASDRSLGRAAKRVPTFLLSDVIDCYGPDDGQIDFLKIDVEGWEAEVIASGDWARHRPRVLVIEAVDDKGHPTHQAWEPTLLGADYRFAMFDGLNRFYCRNEDAELLLPRLSAPANVLDGWRRVSDVQAHASAHRLQAELAAAERRALEAEERSEALGADLEEARASERGARSRVEEAVQEGTRARAEAAEAMEAMQEATRARAEAAEAMQEAMQEATRARAEAAEAMQEATRLRSELAEIPAASAIDTTRARAEAAAALHREEAAEARMAVLEMDLVRRDAAERAQRAANEQAAAWVAAVQTSTSWRVTAPLRAVSLLLRGLRGRR